MRISSLTLWIALALSAHSCSRPGSSGAGSQPATFVVDPVTADSTDQSANSVYQGLPSARMFQFTACVKDVGVLQPIASVTFRVYNGEQLVDTPTTDANGCLHWSESISFQAAEKETFFESSRTIEAASVHQGKVVVSLALDPWQKGKEALRDLRFQPAPPALRRQGSASGAPASALSIETIGTDLEIQGGGQGALLRLSFQPKLKRISLDGSPVNERLEQGRLRLRAQIVANSGGSSLPLTEILEWPALDYDKGVVRAEQKAPLLALPPREALLELRLSAEAADAPGAVLPAHGRASLGSFANVNLSASAAFVPLAQVDFLASAPTAATGTAPVPGSAAAKPARGFVPGRIRAEGLEVLELDGLGKPKVVEFRLTTCLKNALSLQPILNETFHLQSGGQGEDLSTDSDSGCLHWRQRLSFDYSANQSPVRKELSLKGTGGFYAQDSVSRVIYLLPWKTEDGSASVLDELLDGPPARTAADSASSGPELVLTSASYNFQGRKFELDSRLNLGTLRRYRFSLRPAIRRMSRAKGWLPPEGVGNGRFRVKFLLESSDLDHPRLVDARTVEAESLADSLNLDVDFHIPDLRAVMGRLKLSIQVEPLDSSVQIATRPYSDTIELLKPSATLALAPLETAIDARMAAAAGEAPAAAEVNAQLFARAFQLQPLDEAAMKNAGLERADAEALAGGDDKALRKFCGLFFARGLLTALFSSYDACLLQPAKHLAMARTEHVRQLKSSRLSRPPESSSLGISASIYFSSDTRHDNTSSRIQSTSVDTTISQTVPLLNLVGLNVGVGVRYGVSWSNTVSTTKSQSSGSRHASDTSKSISVDQATFDLNADIDRCVTVSQAKKPESGKRFFYCQAQAQNRSVQETYYFLYELLMPSALQDADAESGQQPFLALVRGSSRFQSFAKALRDNSNQLMVGGDPPIPAEALRASNNGYDGLFPGLLTPSR